MVPDMRKFETARYLALLLMVSLSCRSTSGGLHSTEHKEKSATEGRPAAAAEEIAPNHCRVSATVISIDTVYRSLDQRDPCSKAPCHVHLRVDSIHGYGQAFAHPLSAGDTLAVTFAFTVAPAKDVLPTMSESYPGVCIGTKILTDVLASQSLSAEQFSSLSYYVFGYSIL